MSGWRAEHENLTDEDAEILPREFPPPAGGSTSGGAFYPNSQPTQMENNLAAYYGPPRRDVSDTGVAERASNRRPDFLRDDYDRSASAPLVPTRGTRRERETEVYERPTNGIIREREAELRRRESVEPVRDRIVGRGEERDRRPSPPAIRYEEVPRYDRDYRREDEIAREREVRRTRRVSPIRVPAMVETTPTATRQVDQVIWDPMHTKDITLHLELDTTEDLEPVLDEYCRLGRLGKHKQASQLFRDELEQHIDNPYVFVQHAEELLYVGDYKSIIALEPPFILENPRNDLLELNWKLIRSLAMEYSKVSVDKRKRVTRNELNRAVNSILLQEEEDFETADEMDIKTYVQRRADHTKIGARFVREQALHDLGYEFERQGNKIVVFKALAGSELEELIKKSRLYRSDKSKARKFPTSSESEILAKEITLAKARLDILEPRERTFRDRSYQDGRLRQSLIHLKSKKRSLDVAAAAETHLSLGSTECKLFNLALRYSRHLNDAERHDIKDFSLNALYHNLLRQGRVWDFRDIFEGAVLYFGKKRACKAMFGTNVLPIDKIISDWTATTYDESTFLALLDVFVLMFFVQSLSAKTPKNMSAVQHIVNQAGNLTSHLIKHNPENTQSRQYIAWVLAKVLTTSRSTSTSSSRPTLPGVSLDSWTAAEPLIYVPVDSETSDWDTLYLPTQSLDTLQLVLKAAKEIGDLEIEALCLQSLIIYSPSPGQHFDTLINFQKNVQNDMIGWLRTCLAKYNICQDRESQLSLQAEILSVSNYNRHESETIWARCMILRALTDVETEKEAYLKEARKYAKKYLWDSPIWYFMKEHGFMGPNETTIKEKLRSVSLDAKQLKRRGDSHTRGFAQGVEEGIRSGTDKRKSRSRDQDPELEETRRELEAYRAQRVAKEEKMAGMKREEEGDRGVERVRSPRKEPEVYVSDSISNADSESELSSGSEFDPSSESDSNSDSDEGSNIGSDSSSEANFDYRRRSRDDTTRLVSRFMPRPPALQTIEVTKKVEKEPKGKEIAKSEVVVIEQPVVQPGRRRSVSPYRSDSDTPSMRPLRRRVVEVRERVHEATGPSTVIPASEELKKEKGKENGAVDANVKVETGDLKVQGPPAVSAVSAQEDEEEEETGVVVEEVY